MPEPRRDRRWKYGIGDLVSLDIKGYDEKTFRKPDPDGPSGPFVKHSPYFDLRRTNKVIAEEWRDYSTLIILERIEPKEYIKDHILYETKMHYPKENPYQRYRLYILHSVLHSQKIALFENEIKEFITCMKSFP